MRTLRELFWPVLLGLSIPLVMLGVLHAAGGVNKLAYSGDYGDCPSFEMGFESVLQDLRCGHPIRRDDWPPYIWVWLDETEGIRFGVPEMAGRYQWSVPWSPQQEDLFADGWQALPAN